MKPDTLYYIDICPPPEYFPEPELDWIEKVLGRNKNIESRKFTIDIGKYTFEARKELVENMKRSFKWTI